jgi:hypothetical protein
MALTRAEDFNAAPRLQLTADHVKCLSIYFENRHPDRAASVTGDSLWLPWHISVSSAEDIRGVDRRRGLGVAEGRGDSADAMGEAEVPMYFAASPISINGAMQWAGLGMVFGDQKLSDRWWGDIMDGSWSHDIVICGQKGTHEVVNRHRGLPSVARHSCRVSSCSLLRPRPMADSRSSAHGERGRLRST